MSLNQPAAKKGDLLGVELSPFAQNPLKIAPKNIVSPDMRGGIDKVSGLW